MIILKFEDHLKREQKNAINKKFNRIKRKKNNKKDSNKVSVKPKLSRRELEELMDTNKRGLKRKKGGAWG